MNNCIFTGRLTKSPELKKTSQGVPLCSFIIAVEHYINPDKKEVFHAWCEAWSNRALAIAKQLKRGDLISVRTTARQLNWESEGVRNEKIVFRVEEFLSLSSDSESEQSTFGAGIVRNTVSDFGY